MNLDWLIVLPFAVGAILSFLGVDFTDKSFYDDTTE